MTTLEALVQPTGCQQILGLVGRSRRLVGVLSCLGPPEAVLFIEHCVAEHRGFLSAWRVNPPRVWLTRTSVLQDADQREGFLPHLYLIIRAVRFFSCDRVQ